MPLLLKIEGAYIMGEMVIKSQRFRHKTTGEVVTQIPILEINDYEEVD